MKEPKKKKLLADRQAAVRRARFVGRQAEIELFRAALLAEQSPFSVLYVYGPGGVGKTTLLREYVTLAKEHGSKAVLVDGRNLEPSPSDFLKEVGRASGADTVDSPLDALTRSGRAILFIDTFESLAPLEGWLRQAVLPELPESSLVVIAGRTPPTREWRSDLEWAQLTRAVSLRNLRPEESETYLTIRGVPSELHADALTFTHGHPLALSLVADLQEGGEALELFDPVANPDIVQTLLDAFLRRVPGPGHRRALDVCAHVWNTTESLLADVLGAEQAGEIFSWLRGVSFIEQGPRGLFPHDLAREVLDADLRWRNPEAYERIHHQVRMHFTQLQSEARGRAKQSVMTDLTYLYRHNRVTRSYYDWDALGNATAEPAAEKDHRAILDMVGRHEGADSVEIARYWLRRQPSAFTMFRSGDDRSLGFILMPALTAITADDADADPAMAAARHFIERSGPLRTGEELDYIRYWMGRDRYQDAAMNNLVTMVAGTVFRQTGPRRALSFAAVADTDHWEPFFAYLGFPRAPDADFAVGGRRYGVFSHDWRVEPREAWTEALAHRQLATDLMTTQAEASSAGRLVVLSEPEFTEAVKQALRDYTGSAALAANPLLRSRLLATAGDGDPTPATLQAVLREEAETLRANPRDEKLYRAILRTYLEPAPTQERAAERLGLPFSTYRYHLTKGIARIAERLWQRELHLGKG